MATHIQRKQFPARELAEEAAAGFHHPAFAIPGVRVTAIAREVDAKWWVYLAQETDLIEGDFPLLPEYEAVPAS